MIPIPDRLLFVQPNSEIGGSDIALARTVESLKPAGIAISVILPKEGPLVSKLEAAGARIHYVPMQQLRTLPSLSYQARYLAQIVPSVRAVSRIIREERPRLVHTNSLYCIYGALAARATGTPHIWHIRELAPDIPILKKCYAAMVTALSTHIVSMTNICSDRLFDRRPANLTVMPDALDRHAWAPHPDRRRIRSELGIGDDTPVVGFVARLDTWKGCEIFIESAAIVAKRHPSAHFLICGGPPPGFESYARTMEKLAETRGLSERIRFLGWRYILEDMPDVMASLDVFCHTSTSPEPFGLVLVKGMAVGTPVIASAAGGPLDIVEDGVSGLLVTPGDPTALADAVTRLLDDAGLRASLGAKGRDRLDENFSVEEFRKRLLGIYATALDAA